MESNYLPRYKNLSIYARHNFYENLEKKMIVLWNKWFGSAYSLSSLDVELLMEDIFTGKTTFAKWKKAFEENNIRANMGLGPNDPIPVTKKKVNLSKVPTEDLIEELKRRNALS